MSAPPEFLDSFDVEGRSVTVRTMQPQDRDIEDVFVRSLSDESRYYRFHGALRKLSATMLDHFTSPQYPEEMALIATIVDGDAEQQIGVVRYARTEVSNRAEVAIVVADEWQGKGIGTRMMTALRDLARDAGIQELEVNILRENRRMLGLARQLGYLQPLKADGPTTVVLGKRTDPSRGD